MATNSWRDPTHRKWMTSVFMYLRTGEATCYYVPKEGHAGGGRGEIMLEHIRWMGPASGRKGP